MMQETPIPSRRTFLGTLAAACAAAGLTAPARLALGQPAAGTPAAEPDPRADFFKVARVTKLTLAIKPADIEALKKDPKKYIRALLRENDVVNYPEVAVRLKGTVRRGKGIDEKPSLTLNADKFTDAQRFHGIDKFSLHVPRSDPSLLSGLLATELYRAAKVPVPAVSHVQLVINGKARGLYVLREGFDNGFLKRHFGTNNGNLYEGDAGTDIDQPLKVKAGKSDVKERADLKAVVEAARDADLASRLRRLGERIDLEAFIGMLAVGAVVADDDGYAAKRANYRIYHDPKADRCHFIPADPDGAWSDPSAPVLPTYTGLVARAIVETPEGRKRLLDRLDAMKKDNFSADALAKRLTDLQKVLLAGMDVAAAKEYPAHVEALSAAVKARAKKLTDELPALLKA